MTRFSIKSLIGVFHKEAYGSVGTSGCNATQVHRSIVDAQLMIMLGTVRQSLSRQTIAVDEISFATSTIWSRSIVGHRRMNSKGDGWRKCGWQYYIVTCRAVQVQVEAPACYPRKWSRLNKVAITCVAFVHHNTTIPYQPSLQVRGFWATDKARLTISSSKRVISSGVCGFRQMITNDGIVGAPMDVYGAMFIAVRILGYVMIRSTRCLMDCYLQGYSPCNWSIMRSAPALSRAVQRGCRRSTNILSTCL